MELEPMNIVILAGLAILFFATLWWLNSGRYPFTLQIGNEQREQVPFSRKYRLLDGEEGWPDEQSWEELWHQLSPKDQQRYAHLKPADA